MLKISNTNKRRLKWLVIGGIILVLVKNIESALEGKTSIWTFSVIITFAFLVLEGVLRIARASRKSRVNVRLLFSSIWVGILIGELILRGTGLYASYNEKMGDSFYLSQYHFFPGAEKTWLHLRVKRNDTMVMEFPEFEYILETNAEGLKDINHREQKAENEYRIVGLGDSFTEGVGATVKIHSWLKILENSLNMEPGGQTTTVLNAGVSGSDPFFEYMLLEQKMLKYSPDLVIVAINSTDVNDIIARGGMERFLPDTTVQYRSAPWFEPLFGMSHICRYVLFDMFGYDWYLIKSDEQVRESEKAVDLIYSCILKFEESSEKNHFDLLIVFHPLNYEIIANQPAFTALIRKLGKETNIHVLDLWDFYVNEEKMNAENVATYYWPIDAHHNDEGYTLFAKGVSREIARLKLINRSSGNE